MNAGDTTGATHDEHPGRGAPHATHDGGHGDQSAEQATRDEHATHGKAHGPTHGPGHGPTHGPGHGDHAAQFRDRFWWSVALAVPIVAFSPTFAELLGYDVPAGTAWVAPVLGSILFFYGGWPFLTGAAAEIRRRRPGMMLLVALAITVAFVASLITSLGLGALEVEVWWELALLLVIMLLGHWLEMRALGQASSALDALAALLPDDAERLDADNNPQPVTVAELAVGDVVLIRPGGRIPADGVVVAGEAEVDESMITGESRAVAKGKGDRVVAGTVATDSTVRVRVEAVGEDTALAGIQRLVADAQGSRSRAQTLADRAAALLFYFAVAVGAVTFAVWTLLGDSDQAIRRTATVLVIACPHALGLAIPLVIAISTALSARAGILIRDRMALENMRNVTAVLFDKTGTLTTGHPAVRDSFAVDGDKDALLALAAAVESDSEHPLARAIVSAAGRHGRAPAASGFRNLAGRGVLATVDGTEYGVGGPRLLAEHDVAAPRDVEEAARRWSDAGATVLYVLRRAADASDGAGSVRAEVLGAVGLADEVRPESREAVDALHTRDVRVVMITGDARPVAEAVASDLGIDEVFAEVLPEEKATKVAELQDRGLTVAMVGDGVNDAPALARADVGIAIGAGTDVAIESAGVVLASDDPRAVVSVTTLSRASYRKMRQNLAWAAGYNVIAIPLAAGVLAPVGFTLPMEVGAALMSASTLIVAANAQLLRRVSLRP